MRRENGGMVLFGWAMERIEDVLCDTENANALIYCDQTGKLYQELGAVDIPFRHEFKLAGSHPLGWGFQGGISLLSYSGAPLSVIWNVPANLFPGGRTEVVTVPLVAPGTRWLERWNQLDINVKRIFRAGRMEFQPTFEVFNLLNSSVVLSENQNFGPSLGAPTQVLQGRFIKLGGLIRF
jgi:hypothetical protein